MPETSDKWNKIKSILVVDDDDNWCYLSKKILEKSGYTQELIISRNGLEALKVLEAKKIAGEPLPNLIFLDIKMPVMDGFGFLEKVNQADELDLSQTRIYMCSSSLNPKDKEQAYQFPITGYIPKPLTKEILEEIIG